jgi:hypothetical protein
LQVPEIAKSAQLGAMPGHCWWDSVLSVVPCHSAAQRRAATVTGTGRRPPAQARWPHPATEPGAAAARGPGAPRAGAGPGAAGPGPGRWSRYGHALRQVPARKLTRSTGTAVERHVGPRARCAAASSRPQSEPSLLGPGQFQRRTGSVTAARGQFAPGPAQWDRRHAHAMQRRIVPIAKSCRCSYIYSSLSASPTESIRHQAEK